MHSSEVDGAWLVDVPSSAARLLPVLLLRVDSAGAGSSAVRRVAVVVVVVNAWSGVRVLAWLRVSRSDVMALTTDQREKAGGEREREVGRRRLAGR